MCLLSMTPHKNKKILQEFETKKFKGILPYFQHFLNL